MELDAYEKLKRAKRGSESFSAVVRRASFEAEDSTGESILEETAALYRSGKGARAKELDFLDEVLRSDQESPRISPSAWEELDPR